MVEKDDKKVLGKIEKFLDAQSENWYPNSLIRFERIYTDSSYDNWLKRNTLSTIYRAKEVILTMEVSYLADINMLELSVTYDKINDSTLLQYSTDKRVISHIRYYKREDDLLTYPSGLNEKILRVAREKAMKNGLGKAYITNCFHGSLKVYGESHTIYGYNEGDYLYWLLINGDLDESVHENEENIKYFITEVLDEMFYDSEEIHYEWESHIVEDKKKHSVKVLKDVSDIEVDSSYESEPHIFRWRNEEFANSCKDSTLQPEQEVRELIEKHGRKIPSDAELAGLSPYGEGTQNPCLMINFIHLILDKEYDQSAEAPSKYFNPGKIVVERDFCTFYIDPNKMRLISEYSKWRPTRGKI